jgi:nitrate reductase NapA
MVVTNPQAPRAAEKIWKLPAGTCAARSASTRCSRDRMLKDGKLNFYWTSTTNNMQAGPNLNQERYPGFRNPATSSSSPTPTRP